MFNAITFLDYSYVNWRVLQNINYEHKEDVFSDSFHRSAKTTRVFNHYLNSWLKVLCIGQNSRIDTHIHVYI